MFILSILINLWCKPYLLIVVNVDGCAPFRRAILHLKMSSSSSNESKVADTTEADIVSDRTTGRARWRKADPSSSKRSLNRKRRSEGECYENSKRKMQPAKEPKPVDCEGCRFSCPRSFSSSDRETICRSFWMLDFYRQKDFILMNVDVNEPKNRRPRKQDSLEKRQDSKAYFFSKNGEKIRVCQKFFCSTLSISNKPILNAFKFKGKVENVYKGQDRRGRIPPNKTPKDMRLAVKHHIESFPVMESHYTRKSTKRMYLDSKLSIRKMYELYVEKCKTEGSSHVSQITYRRIFCKEYNLSFFKPKKDQCSTCSRYKMASGEEKKELMESYDQHILRKDAAMKEKTDDKKRCNEDPSFLSITCDLQSVLQIPSASVGLLYYMRKINVYNFTIYEAAKPSKGYCYYWSELNGKRGSCEIGSCLLQYLNQLSSEVTHLTLFSDTCGGQNRNIQISSLLLYVVSSHPTLHTIEQKFMESGHSYMEVDSMHSSIETAKKNVDVFSIQDWETIFKSARKSNPFITREMEFTNFVNLKNLAATTITNRKFDQYGNVVNWLKVKSFIYRKSDPLSIGYRYDFSDEYKLIPVSGSKRRSGKRDKQNFLNFPSKLYNSQIPISAAKKRDLVSLCSKNVIPSNLHSWFEALPSSSEVKDLAPEHDEALESED